MPRCGGGGGVGPPDWGEVGNRVQRVFTPGPEFRPAYLAGDEAAIWRLAAVRDLAAAVVTAPTIGAAAFAAAQLSLLLEVME